MADAALVQQGVPAMQPATASGAMPRAAAASVHSASRTPHATNATLLPAAARRWRRARPLTTSASTGATREGRRGSCPPGVAPASRAKCASCSADAPIRKGIAARWTSLDRHGRARYGPATVPRPRRSRSHARAAGFQLACTTAAARLRTGGQRHAADYRASEVASVAVSEGDAREVATCVRPREGESAFAKRSSIRRHIPRARRTP